jgi:hypothetical protein
MIGGYSISEPTVHGLCCGRERRSAADDRSQARFRLYVSSIHPRSLVASDASRAEAPDVQPRGAAAWS